MAADCRRRRGRKAGNVGSEFMSLHHKEIQPKFNDPNVPEALDRRF
jgi:hypothetical protein